MTVEGLEEGDVGSNKKFRKATTFMAAIQRRCGIVLMVNIEVLEEEVGAAVERGLHRRLFSSADVCSQQGRKG